MTELELYKFVAKHNVEYHWHEGEVYLLPNIYLTEEFNNLFHPCVYDDGGIECIMRDGYFSFKMKDICDYYGIDLENVFEKESEK